MSSLEKASESESEWLKDELSSISLGDKRLNRRLQDTAEKLASHPNVSINQACDDWAGTKARYRLFDNPKTTAEKILLPHQERTKMRMQGQKIVLAVQDTAYLDYSHHPSKAGMGPIGTEKQKLRGLVMHSTLALTSAGLPLGIVSQSLWARDEEPNQMTPDQRRNVPIEEKESYKWLAALTETAKYIPAGTQCVNVGDSESDIFERFDHARSLQTDLLVRAAQDRSVCEPAVGRLWHYLEVPTVQQVTRWIARLGGFLDRKHDGPPRVTVFWRGWQRLAHISSTWLISHPT